MNYRFFFLILALSSHFLNFGFYAHPLEEALHKNQPEKLFAYLSQKGILSAKEKKRYLEQAHILVNTLSLNLHWPIY